MNIKIIFTLHAQCNQGKVVGVGVHIIYICDRTWEKGPIGVVDHFLFFYTFGTCASLPHYGYLSEC